MKETHGTTSLLSDGDLWHFREGTHTSLYRALGAHVRDGGTHFAVWAPNAEAVALIGDFNGWDAHACALAPRSDDSGIWETFAPGIGRGARYKYHVRSRYGGYRADKGDPFAFCWEEPPATSSRVWTLEYEWSDGEWMQRRGAANALDAPWSVYEVHAGSWMGPRGHLRNYRDLAEPLADHVTDLGFTHVEFLPLMEHPFYGSWGYQTVGYFAPTARYGTPQDLMYLVDRLHQRGIGVIFDWVPSHFPDDLHGLAFFDGTHLFEHEDRRLGYHPEWHSYLFNYGRHEVKTFLVSSALFWLDRYHVDAIRVDAVASMLYRDYARKDGEWLPNESGGRENYEAIRFLRDLNTAAYREHPGTQMIAEESTAWPMVSRPVDLGGLGFGMKWNMGWMHDTLEYFRTDPLFRKYHHRQVTFSLWYAFMENFVLSLSHDEVVYGKQSLLGKMPGDEWQRFANLRTLLGYMYMHPGKKLLFMGAEYGKPDEWDHERGLDWSVRDRPSHAGVQNWMRDVNALYRSEPALWQQDFAERGFEWIDCNDSENSVISFVRKNTSGDRLLLVVVNFTPVAHANYQIGAPRGGYWQEILNSDAVHYGGSGRGNLGGVEAAPTAMHGRYHSLALTLPPLSVSVFRNVAEGQGA